MQVNSLLANRSLSWKESCRIITLGIWMMVCVPQFSERCRTRTLEDCGVQADEICVVGFEAIRIDGEHISATLEGQYCLGETATSWALR